MVNNNQVALEGIHNRLENANGKVIQRSEFHQYIEENAQRVLQNPDAYKKRQAIVEHPYGTIKRQWSFDHIITKKTKQRASADVGLMFIAYNLKRIWNILRETNISIFKAHKFFITLIESLQRCLKAFLELNSKIKSKHSTNTKNCNLVETLKIAVGY